MENKKRLSDIISSPLRVYIGSLFLSLAIVTVACIGLYIYIATPEMFSNTIFVKDYASGFAAITTLFIGIPITTASSVAVVMLASATVKATREAPLYEQNKSASEIVIKFHERWSPLVLSLNRMDLAIFTLERALEKLYYPVPSFDVDGKLEDESDWFSSKKLDETIIQLKKSVISVCKEAHETLLNPLVQMELNYRLLNTSLLLQKESINYEVPVLGNINALITFLDRVEVESARKRPVQMLSRLKNHYVNSNSGYDERGDITVNATLRVGAPLAVAGLMLWETDKVVEEDDVKGSGGQAFIHTTVQSETMPVAAFLHDLINIVPNIKSTKVFISRYADSFGLNVTLTNISANAEIYAPSLGLNPRLMNFAKEFEASIDSFKKPVGSKEQIDLVDLEEY